MKKLNLLTRNFIYNNIKVNTSVCSYPLRKVAPSYLDKSNDVVKKENSKRSGRYPCVDD